MFKRLGIFIGLLLLLGIFYWVDPGQSWFVPRCPFHWVTGLDCPACGTQRALHQFLHLNIIGAVEYNFFLLISIPYLLALSLVQWFNADNRFPRLKAICHHRLVVNTYLVLIMIWWVVRNILGI